QQIPDRIPHHPARNSRRSHLRGQHMGTSPRNPHQDHTSTHRHSLGRRFNPAMAKPQTTRGMGQEPQRPSRPNAYGVTRVDLTQITTSIIGGSGILGFAATVYQPRQKSSTDTAHTEVEESPQESADSAAFTDRIQKYKDYQDQQINSLRAEIESLKKERQADIAYVDLLNYWIWKRLPPPPPKRGDGYPDEDQVGG